MTLYWSFFWRAFHAELGCKNRKNSFGKMLKGSTFGMGWYGPWIVHCQCLPTAINRAVMKMATWTWTIYDKKWNLSRVLKVSFEFAKYDNRRAYFLRQTNYKCLFCLWMKEQLVKRLLLFMYKICIFGIFWNLCRLLMQS